MIQRFRVWLATWLLRSTPCAVVRLQPLVSLNNVAVRLREYVDRSGALQDPRRVNAYRTVLRTTTEMATAASTLLVDTHRVLPTPASAAQEEAHAPSDQADAEAQSA